jgi:hypothetical protein
MHPLEPAWDALKRDFDGAVSQCARAARHQLANELNQTVRRLRNYQNESDWIAAVLDGVAHFSRETAVFTVQSGRAILRAKHGLDILPDLSFEIESAGAFSSAAESRDPVVALRTTGEVGSALSSSEAGARAHIFPVLNGTRVAALIFAADPDYLDVNALELIGGIASAVLERNSNSNLHAHIKVLPDVTPAEPPQNGTASHTAPKPKASLPPWADLSEEQRTIHIKAQRFSRVAVAEMQLARPEACRAGRAQKNLYVFLKAEIDKARDAYRKQFMTIPSMVDYLHLELVRTAAEGDEIRLGEDYPGQLV